MQRRYQVHDEDGLLRSFYTKEEAEEWILDGMKLAVLPRKKKEKIDVFKDAEEALF